ncbi:hypothetical protein KVR01_013524 [Diaporthe batatas]|uniref:uncharacterized protein n=1 Tax=Diaporthe batatas TaxID=748121 RepID=UPI001D045FA9|nr:uncharacterized protein KVR01_013524 [Diaporthe batatas]KAG8156573.1 hypothetical protein KVR01_013524 [Diaporthe batatas]
MAAVFGTARPDATAILCCTAPDLWAAHIGRASSNRADELNNVPAASSIMCLPSCGVRFPSGDHGLGTGHGRGEREIREASLFVRPSQASGTVLTVGSATSRAKYSAACDDIAATIADFSAASGRVVGTAQNGSEHGVRSLGSWM